MTVNDEAPTLTKCKVCNKDVASSAPCCPHCGVEEPSGITPPPPAGMANCRVCKKHVPSFGMKKCPHCGAEDPAMSGKEVMVIVVIVVILAVWALIAFNSSSSSTSSDTKTDSSAWIMAQHFVSNRLKSPSTASYGWQVPSKCVVASGTNRWRVSGWVDSHNSFGATIRSDFSCVIVYHTDDLWKRENGNKPWELESMTMD